ELKDAVHGAAARFDDCLYAVHDHLGVHFDRRRFSSVGFVATRMRALSGDVDEAVVNNQWRDESLPVGGLSVTVQFLHAPGSLDAGSGSSRESKARQKGGQLCCET